MVSAPHTQWAGSVWFTIAQGVLTEIYYPTIDALKCAIWSFCFPMETNCFSKILCGSASVLASIRSRVSKLEQH